MPNSHRKGQSMYFWQNVYNNASEIFPIIYQIRTKNQASLYGSSECNQSCSADREISYKRFRLIVPLEI